MIKINLQRFAVPDNIILGDGVFYINSTAIALTRGGGEWSLEREYHEVDADGDYGPVKGRIRKIKSRAKLKLNALELLPANLPKMYPATQTTSAYGVTSFTAKDDIEDADYQDEVSWVGITMEGKECKIILENAINLENIVWPLIDKDEIVPEITYTATYLESARTTEPWQVDLEE